VLRSDTTWPTRRSSPSTHAAPTVATLATTAGTAVARVAHVEESPNANTPMTSALSRAREGTTTGDDDGVSRCVQSV